jgi:DNA-binding transcriptional MerR regulator
MNSFTISQLQRYSGINVHSIRAWEKRYDALKPDRSEGNTRYYNGNQLRRLLNIASLMNSGYKISALCSMSDSELNNLMRRQFENSINGDEFLVSQMVAAGLEFSESLFDKIFSRAVMNYGIEEAYLKVIYPSLHRLGVLWSADGIAPAQEHFISNLIRQKLNTSIDLLPVNEKSKKHWILFLPENEFHESGLLMANYLIRKAGHRCTYLGANVPMDTLIQAIKQLKPTSLLFFLVSKDDELSDRELIRSMVKNFPSQKIFVAAEPNRLTKMKSYKSITPLNALAELQAVLKMSK